MLTHILSAVQNSVEEAALDAAHAARVTTAGWMPHEMPHGFLQRQPRGRPAQPLQSGRLSAFGMQKLVQRTNRYSRADEHNLLAADSRSTRLQRFLSDR